MKNNWMCWRDGILEKDKTPVTVHAPKARKGTPKAHSEVLVCPRCGNTLVERGGSFLQCVSSYGKGHYEAKGFVLDHEGCGYVGTHAEFTRKGETLGGPYAINGQGGRTSRLTPD